MTQNGDHPGDYWSNSQACLGRHWISAKSIAEQLGISHEWVGSITDEDLDMQKLSTKWIPKCLNGDQKRQRCQSSDQLLQFFQRNPNDFLSWLVTMDELVISLWPGTKQQSMEWRHSGSPCPEKFQVQKSTGKVLASIFWGSRRHPPHWLSPKGPNYECGVLLISSVATEGHFERKSHGRSPRGSCSCTTMPQLTGHLQPRRNRPTWASIVFIIHPIFQIWPHQTTTCSLDWKNNWKVTIFSPMRRSLLPWRPGWMDNLLNFFLSGLQKLEQWAKKCIELRGEYVE